MASDPTSAVPAPPLYAADILERVADAVVVLGPDWRILYANREACRINQKPAHEFVGAVHWDEWPAAVGTALETHLRRAMAERAEAHFEHRYADGPYDVWLEIDIYPVSADAGGGLSLFYRDVTARRRAEAALEAGEVATWTWDLAAGRILGGERLARLFSLSPAELEAGRPEDFLRAVHPDDRAALERAVADAAASGADTYSLEYRVLPPGGAHRWLVTRGRVERDGGGRAVSLPGVVADITEQTERGRRERFLADFADRVRALADPEAVIADAVRSAGEFLGVSRCIFADIDIEADTCTIRPDYRADPSVPSIEGVVSIAAFGAYVVAEYAARRAVAVGDVRLDPEKAPPETVAAYEAIGIRAHVTVPVVHTGRVVSCMSVHSATPRHWTPEEIETLRAVVERTWLSVEVLRQQAALAREADELHAAHARTASILESITDAFFALDADWRFTYLNDQCARVIGRAREELLGRVFWDEFPESSGTVFERGYRRAVAEQATVTFEDYYLPLDLWVEVRAYPSPSGLSVFYQDVSARKRAEAERDRLLGQERERAEREALINRIGQALLAPDDAARAEGRAVALLGEALGADRCFLTSWGLTATGEAWDRASVLRDFRRPGLPSLAGDGSAADALTDALAAVSAPDAVPPGEAALCLVDTLAAHGNDAGETLAPPLRRLGLRSVLAVPLRDGAGRVAAALWLAMTGGPRDWTPEEVSLAETAAALTRTAVEAARLAERERNIARRLQGALQPPLPAPVSGLALSSFYRPALAEAGVGGDFFDVFALEKGRTVLVVGDLSGKGLAAAAQVSTVRNMLRAFLYSLPTVAEAVTELNRVLAENGLLSGFSTLFVGAYDSASGRLEYVNCGQEPALVRRAGTGAVEPLGPTGPILGAIEGAAYEASRARLGPGDALAVFTDGLTEVGASRTAMLGVEGVAALLTASLGGDGADEQADRLARRVIAGVDEYAQSGARDDMCLLTAVAP